MTGKNKDVYCCNICNSRCTQLKTNLGSAWPPKGWSAKSEEQKAEFWNHIKSISKAKDLVQYVEYIDESVRENIKGSSDKVKYLPLKVWGKKGYSKKLIKSKCTNIKDHPVLGKTYGIRLSELFELDQDRDTKGERCLIKKASGNAGMAKPAKPRKLSEEDKAATKEAKEKLGLRRRACQRFVRCGLKAIVSLATRLYRL